MRVLNQPNTLLHARKNVEFFDDFMWYISPHFWTSDTSDDNDVAPAVGDAEHGVLTLSATTDDNEETGIFSTNEFALFQADCTYIQEFRVQYAEAATSAMNCAFGACDAPNIDDWITDNGGAANTTGSGVMIYKLDGGTVWRANAEINGTVKDTASEITAGGSAYAILTIEGRAVDATNYEFMYFIDNGTYNGPLTDATYHRPIMHTIAYASATEMNLQLYLKIGSTTTETALVDYTYYGCLRV